LPCRRWIWSATRCIGALAQMNPGRSGSSCRSITVVAASTGRSRASHRSKPCRRTVQSIRNRWLTATLICRVLETTAKRGPPAPRPIVSTMKPGAVPGATRMAAAAS
jgi:hypothetical protein